MIFIVLGAILPISVVLLLLLILYARWNYGVLEAMGVPVVKPSFFRGSIPHLHRTVAHEEDVRRFKELGPTFGVYEGRNPILYTCDPDLIKSVTTTESSYFENRREVDFGNCFFNEMLDFQPYNKWKVVRSHSMPAFSPSKLKHMTPGMEDCMKDLLERLQSVTNAGSVVDIRREVSGYALAVAALNLFGIRVSSPQEESNTFRMAAKETIEDDSDFSAIYSLSLTFPWLTKLAPTNPPSSTETLEQMVDMTMAKARSSFSSVAPPTEFVSRLISLLDKVKTPEYTKLGITKTTVYGQAITMFIVNFEGLTATLVLLSYYLALSPRAQEKLHEELNNYFRSSKNKTASDLLPYLTACLEETLRLTPIPRRVERICTQDCEINGIRFKKGLQVMVPLYASQRNPLYFPDPDQFQPERFLPENRHNIHPYTVSFFGHGPRSCSGQRYAMDLLRFSAARLFHKFEFYTCPRTELKFKPGRMFIVQFEPIYLEVTNREITNEE